MVSYQAKYQASQSPQSYLNADTWPDTKVDPSISRDVGLI